MITVSVEIFTSLHRSVKGRIEVSIMEEKKHEKLRWEDKEKNVIKNI